MDRKQLVRSILETRSFLCVGLDTDPERIPADLQKEDDPVFEFNKAIIDATQDFCVAYKPNMAFYEAQGIKGWQSLERTLNYIPDNKFVIADAKRGDIGNTSEQYARAFFDWLGCDAVTVAPYMGHDSVMPFIENRNKWVILLALTSNEGALDFQLMRMEMSHNTLFERVLGKAKEWGTPENLMFVVGATRADMLQRVRKIVPDHFLLVPGVGAQGGSLEEVARYGLNADVGLLVNASRSILYASEKEDFQSAAREEAKRLQQVMELSLKEKGLI